MFADGKIYAPILNDPSLSAAVGEESATGGHGALYVIQPEDGQGLPQRKGESGMKRMVKTWVLAVAAIAAAVCTFAPRAAAQGDGSIAGQLLDVAGKPWADIAMQAVSEQGTKQESKTDKDGNYAFRNLRSGVYTVFVMLPAPNIPGPRTTRSNQCGATGWPMSSSCRLSALPFCAPSLPNMA